VTATVGSFALALGFFASVAGAELWARTARASGPAADGVMARQATWLVLVGAAGAAAAMERALVTDDFSVRYVAENSSRATPLFFRVTALWSALDGSLLLWLLVLAGYAVLVARQPPSELQPWAAATVCAVAACFFALTLFASQPFARLVPAAADGPGPNPLLADHPAMGVHPPLLYLGYVGLVVPFAYAVAALAAGRADRDWLEHTRRWLLVAWCCLTAGIGVGAWWSYAVLGWGGYWAWDPVENASLLPWLTATALLHSALLQRRRGTSPVWNVSLAAASFVLVCAGTFLTRSGAVASIHSFTQSPLGPVLLAFLALVVAVVLGLLVWRADRLTPSDDGPAPAASLVSRTTGLQLNNVVLVGLALCVLLGTLFPLLVQVTSGQQVSVGAPFFDRVAVPAALVLLVLMALAPLARWRHDSPGALGRRALLPAAVAAVTVAALGLSGAHGVTPVVTVGLAAAVATTAVRSLLGPALSRGLARGRRRALGGHVAHLGLAVALAGVAASSAWSVAAQVVLRAGASAHVAGADVRLEGVSQTATAGRMTTTADLTIGHGSSSQVARPAVVFYSGRGMTVSQPSIASRVAGDLYLSVLDVSDDSTSVTLRVVHEPLVGWIWAGGALMLLGGALAAVPGRRGASGHGGPQQGDGAPATVRVAEREPQPTMLRATDGPASPAPVRP
jgi:cytochrome c-type biogenesis protein CcmF